MFSKTVVLGNLGKDPELRRTASGRTRCSFRVAANEKWKDAEGQAQDHTEWFHVVVWGPQAEACNKHLSKGKAVLVEGQLRTRSYEKDGGTRYITELVASNVRFVAGTSNGGK